MQVRHIVYYVNLFLIQGEGFTMASVYENSYMIVLIFLLLGILLPVVALTLGKSCVQINRVQRKRRRMRVELSLFMMQIFGFMLVIIFSLYCSSSLM